MARYRRNSFSLPNALWASSTEALQVNARGREELVVARVEGERGADARREPGVEEVVERRPLEHEARSSAVPRPVFVADEISSFSSVQVSCARSPGWMSG